MGAGDDMTVVCWREGAWGTRAEGPGRWCGRSRREVVEARHGFVDEGGAEMKTSMSGVGIRRRNRGSRPSYAAFEDVEFGGVEAWPYAKGSAIQ